MKGKLTKKQIEEIRSLYLQGERTTTIGKEYKIDTSSVFYHCKDLQNVPIIKKPYKNKITTVEIIDETKYSKELREYRKKVPIQKSSNFVARLPKKGLRYADYQRIEREKKKSR